MMSCLKSIFKIACIIYSWHCIFCCWNIWGFFNDSPSVIHFSFFMTALWYIFVFFQQQLFDTFLFVYNSSLINFCDFNDSSMIRFLFFNFSSVIHIPSTCSFPPPPPLQSSLAVPNSAAEEGFLFYRTFTVKLRSAFNTLQVIIFNL